MVDGCAIRAGSSILKQITKILKLYTFTFLPLAIIPCTGVRKILANSVIFKRSHMHVIVLTFILRQMVSTTTVHNDSVRI